MMNLRTMVVGLTADHVAKAFLRLWEHEEGTLEVWRASSNFVYRFENKGKKFFLRFSFEGAQTLEHVEAELDFINYLALSHYSTIVPIRSIEGTLVERVTTSEGLYIGVVFSDAEGESLDCDQMNDTQMEAWGKSLGSLHTCSQVYEPAKERKRKDWRDGLDHIAVALERHSHEKEALMELDNLRIWLYSLKQTKHDYGLIHYDFQQDNIFWHASTSQFHVIDFDDAMYHWYAMDIVAALADVLDNKERDFSRQVECFLRGYTAICPLDKQMIEHFPKFLRFSKLYSFSRILTALEDSDLSNTPPWYAGLRLKLMTVRDEMRLGFSNPW